MKLCAVLVAIDLIVLGCLSAGARTPADQQMNLPQLPLKADPRQEQFLRAEYDRAWFKGAPKDVAEKLSLLFAYYQFVGERSKVESILEETLVPPFWASGTGQNFYYDRALDICRELKKRHQDLLLDECLPYAACRLPDYSPNIRLLVRRVDDVEEAAKCRRAMHLDICYLPGDSLRLDALHGLPNIQSVSLRVSDRTTKFLSTMTGLKMVRCSAVGTHAANIGASLRMAKGLKSLTLDGCYLDRQGAQALSKLSSLEELYFLTSSLDDVDALSCLMHLPNLRKLVLQSSKLNRLPSFATLSRLESLDLSGDPLDEDQMKHISGNVKVKSVNLSRCPIHTADLKRLAKMSSLSELNLSGCKLESEHLKCLSVFKGLAELNIEGTDIKASDFRLLTPITTLVRLQFSHYGQWEDADEWLPQLIQIGGIKEVDLSDAALSRQTLALLGGYKQLESISLPQTLRYSRELNGLKAKKLAGSKLVDSDFKFLSQLPKLKTLKAPWTDLNGSLFASGFEQLEELDLTRCPIADHNYFLICKLGKLKRLNLSGTSVPAGFIDSLSPNNQWEDLNFSGCRSLKLDSNSLARLQSLKKIDLRGTRIGLNQLHQLKEMLPHCEICPDPDAVEQLLAESRKEY